MTNRAEIDQHLRTIVYESSDIPLGMTLDVRAQKYGGKR